MTPEEEREKKVQKTAMLLRCPQCKMARAQWCRTPAGDPFRTAGGKPKLHDSRLNEARLIIQRAESQGPL